MSEMNIPVEGDAAGEPKLRLADRGLTDFELRLSRALGVGSDYIIEYRGLMPEEGKRCLRAEAAARYLGAPALHTVE